MQNVIDKTCKVVQYADDRYIFVAKKFVKAAEQLHENLLLS